MVEEDALPNFRPFVFALVVPSQLKKLTIWTFVLNASHFHQLTESFGVSCRLQSLRLLYPGSSKKAIFPLAAVIARNKSPVDICISGALLNKSSYQDFTRAAEDNSTL